VEDDLQAGDGLQVADEAQETDDEVDNYKKD
jgi:hypothetical protein